MSVLVCDTPSNRKLEVDTVGHNRTMCLFVCVFVCVC